MNDEVRPQNTKKGFSVSLQNGNFILK